MLICFNILIDSVGPDVHFRTFMPPPIIKSRSGWHHL